jgi:Family of unknown function (DUF6498)
MNLRSLLTALGLNAVPALGWFVGEWSAGTMLVLYWLETLIGTLLLAVRIIIHRRIRPSKGHWDYHAPQSQGQQGQAPQNSGRSSYLAAFLVPALVFTFAHGIFLAVLGFMAIKNNLSAEAKVDVHNLWAGLIGIGLFQGADFILDLTRIKDRPFAWIEKLGQITFARVIVVHLTIIGGMAAVMFTGANRNFFGVFIFLKTMLQCSLVIPQYDPKTPPAWLSGIMDRIGSPKYKNDSFAQYWKNTDDQEHARLARNEIPVEPIGRQQT